MHICILTHTSIQHTLYTIKDSKGFRRLWKNLISSPLEGFNSSHIQWNKLGLPQDVENRLRHNNEFQLFTTKIVQRDESKRGDTVKLLIELQDGHRVETVGVL